MTNIDLQLLAQLLALTQGQGATGNGATQWSGTGELDGWTVDRRQDIVGYGPGGEDAAPIYSDPITRLYQSTGSDTWKSNGDTADVYDSQGNFIGGSSGDSTSLGLAKFIAASLAGYYGADAINGMEAGGAAAGGGADAATSAAWQSGAGLGGDTLSAAGTGGGGGAGLGSAAGAWNGTDFGGAAAGGGGGGGAAARAAAGAAGKGLNWGTLLGAGLGYMDGKDKQQTSSRDPWAPAQPYLKGLLSDGADLYNKYKANPISEAQQRGYDNQAGLFNAALSGTPGLMSNIGLLGQGYDRNRANRTQTGYTAPQFDLSGIMSLLNPRRG